MEPEIFFQKQLFQNLKQTHKNVYAEVRYKRKKVDLVQYKKNCIICIEVKLKDWRKALTQASINNIFCDKSYIALPRSGLHTIDQELLKKLKIGLIEIHDGHHNIILDVKKNENKISRYYNEFESILRGIPNGNKSIT